MILKMLEEGKITPEQAVELIAAVGKGASSEWQEAALAQVIPQKDRDLKRIVREEERRARQQVKDESRRSRSAVREALREIRNNLPRGIEHSLVQSLRGIGPGLGGREYSFQHDYSGQFSGGLATINIQNTNGHINLVKSTDDQWHLTLAVRVRADNEAAARAAAKKLIAVTSGDESIVVTAQKLFGQNASANITLKLPDVPASIRSTSTNGTINVANVSGQEFLLKTVNGKVIVDGVTATQIEAGAINGSIIISADTSMLKCKGANGRVEAELRTVGDAQVELSTVNGAIHVTLPADHRIGFIVNADSTAGSVKVAIPGANERDDVHRPGKRSVRAQSQDLEGKPFKQSIRARTVSGKIRIHTEGGGL